MRLETTLLAAYKLLSGTHSIE